jgi:hypothetical protein
LSLSGRFSQTRATGPSISVITRGSVMPIG